MADHSAVIETVKAYLASVSNTSPPYSLEHVLPDGGFVFSHPDKGIFAFRMSQQDAFWEANSKYELAGPNPQVWIRESLAAVQADYVSQGGSGTAAFGLVKLPGAGWKISSVAAAQLPGKPPAPSDPLEPVRAVLDSYGGSASWEKLGPLFLEGAASVEVRGDGAGGPLTSDAFGAVQELQRMTQQLDRPRAELGHDVDVRVVADTALVWAPYTILVADQPFYRGVNVFTLVSKDGKWLLSGSSNTGAKI